MIIEAIYFFKKRKYSLRKITIVYNQFNAY